MTRGGGENDDLLPTHGEPPSRIQETGRVGREGTGDGEADGHLAEGMNGTIQHDADQGEAKEQGGGTTVGQRLTGTDKETGSWIEPRA